GILACFEYNQDLFDDATIARLQDHFLVLLRGITAAPGRVLGELPIVDEAERHALVVERNRTARAYPRDRCVHELFAERAARSHKRPALQCGDAVLTYGELDAAANRLACHLRELGAGPGTLVGLCAGRSIDMVVALLGLFPIGMFGLLVLRAKKLVPNFIWIVLFGLGIWLGIIVIHSYFWAYGLRSSLGLTRVATLGLPVALVFILIGCHFVTKELNTIPHLIGGLLITLLCVKEIRELPYPLHANAFEEILLQSADYIGEKYPKGDIYYYHPLIAWRLNVGIKDNPSRFKQMSFRNASVVEQLKPGTIIVRDPQFGPVEHGLKLLTMDTLSKKLIRVKAFKATKPYVVYTGEPVEVVIYRVAPRITKQNIR
ncbi:MAG: AMP-binding protein, partial [Flavobacteriia bacterium]|nr:AMP-binding protein [Flavobacteriia bacterium]